MEQNRITESNYSFSNNNDLKQYVKIDPKIFNFSTELSNLSQLDDIKKEFFQFTSKSNLKCLPTKDAFFYIPSPSEEFELDAHENILSRKIFEGKQGFLPKEREALAVLQNEIAQYNLANPRNKLEIPTEWADSEIFKILQASKFEAQSAIANLLLYVEFRKSYFPMQLTDKAIEILSKTGFLYCHGRDRCFRPILICRAESYLANVKKYSYNDWLNAIVFFSEYLINHMMIPGQVETWNTIADLSNVSLLSLPTDFHKFTKFLQTNYRSRLNLSFVFGMNRFLDFLWRIIRNFLHPNVEKKIIFLNDANKNLIFETIMPEQLEAKYGGTAENLFIKNPDKSEENLIYVKSLFPPFMPDADFQTNEDKLRLTNENEYVSLAKQGQFVKLSPYIQYEDYEQKQFFTCQQKTSRTKTNGDVSVYEDALSHIYTKLHSENNINHNDLSQYDVCNDYRETFENNEIKTNKISFVGAVKARNFKSKTEENEEYLVAAQNTEEQINHIKKNSSNYFSMVPSNNINTIFNDNNELKIAKSYSKDYEVEVKNSSFYVDGDNRIQLLLLDRIASNDQDDLLYSGKCFNCDVNSQNNEYCLKCIIDRKNIPKREIQEKSIKDNSNSMFNRESNEMNTNIETAKSSLYVDKRNSDSNLDNNTIEKARGGFTLPFEKEEDHKYLSERENTDVNQRAYLRLESNSGADCCSEFNKKCIIF